MPYLTLGEILRNMLVDPSAPLEEGGEPLQAVFGIDPDIVFGLTPRRADPACAEQRAYRAFYYKNMGCGYGVFCGIVGCLAERFGPPYDSFPLAALEHKKGRFSGAGKICGALIGADMAMSLFWGRAEREPLVEELRDWYAAAPLPLYAPPKELAAGEQSVGMEMDMPVSVAGSVMCTDSLSGWARIGGGQIQESGRKERCARVTASVAAKAVEIMNAVAAS